MAPSIRGVRKAPCAHLVAARHARVERIFRNVDTQYSVDHCPILSLHLFSKSSASNNLVRRIYAHARPKIPSSLDSGAWKTGPNLWDRLTRQAPTQAHRSPRCWRDLFIRQAICNVQDDVGRFRDDEFSRSGDATRCSEPRIFREEIFDAIQNVESDAPCGGRVMLGDVRAQ